MDPFEKAKREILQPIYFEAGAGLYDCQSFEYAIAYMMYLAARSGLAAIDAAEITAILDGDSKKTAGQLIRMLEKHLTLSDGLESVIKDALDARNNLIHRYLIMNTERLVDRANHQQIVREIRQLRTRVRRAQKALDPFVRGLMAALGDAESEKIMEDAKRSFLGKGEN